MLFRSLNDLAVGTLVPRGIDANYAYRRLLHEVLTEVEAYLWIADQATRQLGRAMPRLWSRLGHGRHALGEDLTGC